MTESQPDSLTDKGKTLMPILIQMMKWGEAMSANCTEKAVCTPL